MLLAAAVSPSAVPALAALLAFGGPPPATALAVTAAVPIIPPSGAEDTCPSARQVSDALQAHLPAQVQPERVAGTRPDALHALLDVPADGTVVHFSLVDAHGDVQLRRSIPAPGRGRPLADCVALAETLAVIVDRYLSSVPYQASETAPPPAVVAAPAPLPPPPEAPRRRVGYLFVGGSWMMASSNNQASLAGRLGGEVELTRRPLALVAQISVGADQEQKAILSTGSASLERFPGRLGLLLEVPAGPGTFEPGLTAGVDVLMATSTNTVLGRTDRSFRVSPVASAETGYRVTLGRHLFVRPRASLGFAIVTYDVAVGGSNEHVFHTPSTFSTFGLDAGLVFR